MIIKSYLVLIAICVGFCLETNFGEVWNGPLPQYILNKFCPPQNNLYESVYISNPFNCTKYYVCDEGIAVSQSCPFELYWSEAFNQCYWPENVQCSLNYTISIKRISNSSTPSLPPKIDDESHQNNISSSTNNTVDLNKLCQDKETGDLLPYPRNCSKFLECSYGLAFSFDCPSELVWNNAMKICDYIVNVNCTNNLPFSIQDDIPHYSYKVDYEFVQNSKSDKPIPHPGCPSNEDPSNPTQLPYPGDCNKFYKCLSGYAYAIRCPPGLHWSIALNRCEWPSVANCTWGNSISGGINENATNDEGNSNSGGSTIESPKIDSKCLVNTTSEELIQFSYPHDCTKFYKCSNGLAYIQDCPKGLYWNDAVKLCDWSSQVNCSSNVNGNLQVTIEQPHRDSRCPIDDNPEIPTQLPHPYKCDEFYKCFNGWAYPQNCPAGLHWNNILKICDWPENAGCGIKSAN